PIRVARAAAARRPLARPLRGAGGVGSPLSLSGGHDAQPGDAADTNAMSTPAGREADVRLPAERSLDDGGLERICPAAVFAARFTRRGEHGRFARKPDHLMNVRCALPPYAGARSANLANRRRNESLITSVGPFLCLARCTSASPC